VAVWDEHPNTQSSQSVQSKSVLLYPKAMSEKVYFNKVKNTDSNSQTLTVLSSEQVDKD